MSYPVYQYLFVLESGHRHQSDVSCMILRFWLHAVCDIWTDADGVMYEYFLLWFLCCVVWCGYVRYNLDNHRVRVFRQNAPIFDNWSMGWVIRFRRSVQLGS